MKNVFENENLKVLVSEDLMDNVFVNSEYVIEELSLIVDDYKQLFNQQKNEVEFISDEENTYIVFVNKQKVEFDY